MITGKYNTEKSQVLVGDFDGNKIDDIAYVGKCGASMHCIRAHLSDGEKFTTKALTTRLYFSSDTFDKDKGGIGVKVLDYNDDGIDDFGYLGGCGSFSTGRWRYHVSPSHNNWGDIECHSTSMF